MFNFKTEEEYEAEQNQSIEESVEEYEEIDEAAAHVNSLINTALELIDEGAIDAARILCEKAVAELQKPEAAKAEPAKKPADAKCAGCVNKKDVDFLIKDEKEAIAGYKKVISHTSNKDDKATLEHIKGDENEHIRELEGLMKGEHIDKDQKH